MKRNAFSTIANLSLALALTATAWPLLVAAQAAVPPLPPPPPVPANGVEFSAARYLASETNASVTLSVRRGGDLLTEASVRYATLDGTARAGHNYQSAKAVLLRGHSQIRSTVEHRQS